MNDSSQKFIERNRPPMVQIEYEVERYGANAKVQVPFVMGVLADLSGANSDTLDPLTERRFYEIDNETFDERFKAQQPRVKCRVDNKLTGEGKMDVDLSFDSLDDFSPGSIINNDNAPPKLKKVAEMRKFLSFFKNQLDGRGDAQEFIETNLLQNQALIEKIAGDTSTEGESETAAAGEDAGEDTGDGDEGSPTQPR